MPRRINSQKGGILLIVLWGLLFISILAGIQLVQIRTKIKSASYTDIQLREQLALRSALEWAAWEVATRSGRDDYQSFPVELGIGGITVEIDWAEEMTQTDLNLAPESRLQSLFQQYMSKDESSGLAASVSDWRDRDDARRENGAEKSDYILGADNKFIGNRPFWSVSELIHVKGTNQILVDCLIPFVTVDGLTSPLTETQSNRTFSAGTKATIKATIYPERNDAFPRMRKGHLRVTGDPDAPFTWLWQKASFQSYPKSPDCLLTE